MDFQKHILASLFQYQFPTIHVCAYLLFVSFCLLCNHFFKPTLVSGRLVIYSKSAVVSKSPDSPQCASPEPGSTLLPEANLLHCCPSVMNRLKSLSNPGRSAHI